jgi:hypothetical protein
LHGEIKNRLEASQQKFSNEKKKPANDKAFGQPLRATKCDDILKKKGIDQTAQFGGDLEGNGIRNIMVEATSIMIDEIENTIFGMYRVVGMDDKIRNVFERHHQLFLCWNGYFSGLRTKRFHLTDEIVTKMKKYLERSLLLERHLSMSITPKSHVMGDHSIEQLVRTCGFADLGEEYRPEKPPR